MRAKNLHTAALNDTAPGQVGDFDENNVAVVAWLLVGMLERETVAIPAPVDDSMSSKGRRNS